MNDEITKTLAKALGSRGGKKSAEVNKGKHAEWGRKGAEIRKAKRLSEVIHNKDLQASGG